MSTNDTLRNTSITIMILAVGGGVIGGFIHGALVETVSAQSDTSRVVRVTGVELVDKSGNRVGFLGTDEKHNTGLAFFDSRGKKRAEFRLGAGENPRLDINGTAGDTLLSLDLGGRGKPRLMMSEHDFNGRVYLGVAEPDAPDPDWKYDTWVLRFTGDHTKPLAIIGMKTRGAGGVVVRDQSGHDWRTPLKE